MSQELSSRSYVTGAVTSVVAGLAVLGVVGFTPVFDHLARASGEACQQVQKTVAAAATLKDAAAATIWAAGARAQVDDLEDGGILRDGFTRYITVVEATFAGTPHEAQRSEIESDMVRGCPGLKVEYPR